MTNKPFNAIRIPKRTITRPEAKPKQELTAIPTATFNVIKAKLRAIANGRNTFGKNCDIAVEILTVLDEVAIKVDAV